MGCAGVKKITLSYMYILVIHNFIISHLGFLAGGGDGDGDSDVRGAPILHVSNRNANNQHSMLYIIMCIHVHTPHTCVHTSWDIVFQ